MGGREGGREERRKRQGKGREGYLGGRGGKCGVEKGWGNRGEGELGRDIS